MLVVSNTSPLSNLAIIDRLEILRGQCGQILIPPAVQLELDRLSHPAARLRLTTALREGWVRVTPLSAAVPPDLAAALTTEIRKLRAEARFFVSPLLETRLLNTVGE